MLWGPRSPSHYAKIREVGVLYLFSLRFGDMRTLKPSQFTKIIYLILETFKGRLRTENTIGRSLY